MQDTWPSPSIDFGPSHWEALPRAEADHVRHCRSETEVGFAVFTLILSLKSTREKENPCKSCPDTEHICFKKSKVPPADSPALPLALFYFIFTCSEEMKANHFHASSPCIPRNHPPHLPGRHRLLPKDKEHQVPGVQSTLFCSSPCAHKTAGQLFHTSGWL